MKVLLLLLLVVVVPLLLSTTTTGAHASTTVFETASLIDSYGRGVAVATSCMPIDDIDDDQGDIYVLVFAQGGFHFSVPPVVPPSSSSSSSSNHTTSTSVEDDVDDDDDPFKVPLFTGRFRTFLIKYSSVSVRVQWLIKDIWSPKYSHLPASASLVTSFDPLTSQEFVYFVATSDGQLFISKFDYAGNFYWSKEHFTACISTDTHDIFVDFYGVIYLPACSDVLQIDSDGNILRSVTAFRHISGLLIDWEDNIYVSGSIQHGPSLVEVVHKYSPRLEQLIWVHEVDLSHQPWTMGIHLSDGDVFIASRSFPDESNMFQKIVLLRLNNSQGDEVSRIEHTIADTASSKWFSQFVWNFVEDCLYLVVLEASYPNRTIHDSLLLKISSSDIEEVRRISFGNDSVDSISVSKYWCAGGYVALLVSVSRSLPLSSPCYFEGAEKSGECLLILLGTHDQQKVVFQPISLCVEPLMNLTVVVAASVGFIAVIVLCLLAFPLTKGSGQKSGELEPLRADESLSVFEFQVEEGESGSQLSRSARIGNVLGISVAVLNVVFVIILFVVGSLTFSSVFWSQNLLRAFLPGLTCEDAGETLCFYSFSSVPYSLLYFGDALCWIYLCRSRPSVLPGTPKFVARTRKVMLFSAIAFASTVLSFIPWLYSINRTFVMFWLAFSTVSSLHNLILAMLFIMELRNKENARWRNSRRRYVVKLVFSILHAVAFVGWAVGIAFAGLSVAASSGNPID